MRYSYNKIFYVDRFGFKIKFRIVIKKLILFLKLSNIVFMKNSM